ncbi:IQ motif and SEC7 domain-containing protein 1 [Trichoplax sp. H2]|nr:IQ motif and SEC7 domain-containing protein 1 [Trichoplax sp. H2]|eukprot:RDD47245.1 IQ motif and SEC7 domain-containing protein 1 [Trichoplax sp. H2]
MEVISEESIIELHKKINYQAHYIDELKKKIDILEAYNRDLELALLTIRGRANDFEFEDDLSHGEKLFSADENRMQILNLLKSTKWRYDNGEKTLNLQHKSHNVDLSPELRQYHLKMVERKYGGGQKANRAASVIQVHFRKYQMNKRFDKWRKASTNHSRVYRSRSDADFTYRMGGRRPRSFAGIGTALPYEEYLAQRSESRNSFNSRLKHEDANKFQSQSGDRAHHSAVEATQNYRAINVNDAELSQSEATFDKYLSDQSNRDILLKDHSLTDMNETSLGLLQNSDSSNTLQNTANFVQSAKATSTNEEGRFLMESKLKKQVATSGEYKENGIGNIAIYSNRGLNLRTGLHYFNRKPQRGIEYLIRKGILKRDPEFVARFLFEQIGVSKKFLGEYLGCISESFNVAVLDWYINFLDFTKITVDEALRRMLKTFLLPGEAQKIEKIMQVFAHRYCECNEDCPFSEDTMFILSFSMIMLNTDLHNPNIKNERRMKEQDFIRNNRGINDGNDLPDQFLAGIYHRIKQNPFQSGVDHTTKVRNIENSINGKCPELSLPHRQLIHIASFCVVDPNKKEKPGLHPRIVFLFNDMILLTKMQIKKGRQSAPLKVPTVGGSTYNYKSHYTLWEAILSYDRFLDYKFPLQLYKQLDSKIVLTLNASNESERRNFVKNLKLALCEVEAVEKERLGNDSAEIEAQKAGKNYLSRNTDNTSVTGSAEATPLVSYSLGDDKAAYNGSTMNSKEITSTVKLSESISSSSECDESTLSIANNSSLQKDHDVESAEANTTENVLQSRHFDNVKLPTADLHDISNISGSLSPKHDINTEASSTNSESCDITLDKEMSLSHDDKSISI